MANYAKNTAQPSVIFLAILLNKYGLKHTYTVFPMGNAIIVFKKFYKLCS